MGRLGVCGKMEIILKLSVKMDMRMENALTTIRMDRNGMKLTMSMGISMENVFGIMRMGRNGMKTTLSMVFYNDRN